ncbi:MAG: CpaF family protein [Anaerolineales bacterium]|nr:CpaF family protein [Anaerolineales bacterium]
MSANPNPSAEPISAQEMAKLKAELIRSLANQLEMNTPQAEKYRETLAVWLEQTYLRMGVNLPINQRNRMFREIINELAGFGPIQPLLEDDEINEIMVNGPELVFVERKGKLIETNIRFEDDDHIRRIIDRMLSPLGRRVDSDHPAADARLPDGSRVNVVIPPVSHRGSCITIRKFLKNMLTIEQVIEYKTLTDKMAKFLEACVRARLNILISGNTSSGKTTLLNVVAGFIPDTERIITIEDAAELQLSQKHVVSLETKTPNTDGKGGVETRDLVRNVLRMRPDRIIVGEVRSGEALDMLQAMNTGHDGSLTTLHANSPRDAISRLETMAMMAGFDIPMIAIRRQIASAIDLIVHLERLQDGTRRTVNITEVAGMEGDVVTLTDVFKFDQTGTGPDGAIQGELVPTGIRPLFTPKLEVAGYKLGGDIFGAGYH